MFLPEQICIKYAEDFSLKHFATHKKKKFLEISTRMLFSFLSFFFKACYFQPRKILLNVAIPDLGALTS